MLIDIYIYEWAKAFKINLYEEVKQPSNFSSFCNIHSPCTGVNVLCIGEFQWSLKELIKAFRKGWWERTSSIHLYSKHLSSHCLISSPLNIFPCSAPQRLLQHFSVFQHMALLATCPCYMKQNRATFFKRAPNKLSPGARLSVIALGRSYCRRSWHFYTASPSYRTGMPTLAEIAHGSL